MAYGRARPAPCPLDQKPARHPGGGTTGFCTRSDPTRPAPPLPRRMRLASTMTCRRPASPWPFHAPVRCRERTPVPRAFRKHRPSLRGMLEGYIAVRPRSTMAHPPSTWPARTPGLSSYNRAAAAVRRTGSTATEPWSSLSAGAPRSHPSPSVLLASSSVLMWQPGYSLTKLTTPSPSPMSRASYSSGARLA